MKKIVKSMVAASMATALLTSAAGAANFTSSADALNQLGLFKGTENGYELDRVSDRAEAATMLVRLMGKEAEAKAFWEAKTNPQAAAAETVDEGTPAAEAQPAEEVKEGESVPMTEIQPAADAEADAAQDAVPAEEIQPAEAVKEGESVPMTEIQPAEEAKTEETKTEEAEPYVFPFTDMDNGYEWAKPYVAWLYDQGLTSGATATTFEPGNTATAQQYATFLLRALGYSDQNGDFTYEGAIDFAKEKGVVDYINLDDTFDRDNLAAMSYTALSVSPKTGETDLLTKLVADKAIDAETAKPALDTFAALRAFNEAYASAAATTAADATANFTMNMKMAEAAIDAEGAFDVQVKVDPAKPAEMEMALKGAMHFTADGSKLDLPMEMYVKDGVSYVKMADQKIQQDMGLDAMFQGFSLQAMTDMQSVPLCMVDAISKDGDTYKMTYNNEAFNGFFAEIFSAITQNIEITEEMKAQGVTADMFKLSMDLSKADVTVTFKNGNLASEQVDMAMRMGVAGQTVEATIVMDTKYNKVGDAVEVTFPTDLDSYLSAEEAAKAMEEAAAEDAAANETAETEAPAEDAADKTETPAAE